MSEPVVPDEWPELVPKFKMSPALRRWRARAVNRPTIVNRPDLSQPPVVADPVPLEPVFEEMGGDDA